MKRFHNSDGIWEEQMSEKILICARDELYLELRFLSRAFSALAYKRDDRLTTLATDGIFLYYSKEQLFRLFKKNPAYIDRIYLHSVLHCLFSHPWLIGNRKPYLWGIASDIAVEYTIDQLDVKCTRRILGLVRTELYESLRQMGSISAAKIYRYLLEQSPEKIGELREEFFADDHVFWPKREEQKEGVKALVSKWNKLGRQIQTEQKKRGRESETGEELFEYQIKAAKSRRSYREFLRKFMVFHEEMRISEEEFDQGFYLYGLGLYGNMPLIEPLESREEHRIRDFIIVIDTSYSTSGELVRNFLRETFLLLKEQDSFFKKHRFCLIQADEKVQSVQFLESDSEIEEAAEGLEIKGGGGTDFRPVFDYVNELIENGTFEELCGLLYFTDGKGLYPKKRTPYKTAFLIAEDFDEEKIPDWAISLRLEPEEFMEFGRNRNKMALTGNGEEYEY